MKFPAEPKTGARRGEVVFRRPDGRARTHVFEWDVTPRIKATPSGLVARAFEGPVAPWVVLASDGRPFRVLKVSGALLGQGFQAPTGSMLRHSIQLPIDPSKRSGNASASDISISTDHPD